MQRTPCSKAAIAPPRLGAILSGSTTGEAEDRVLSARGEMQPDAKQRIAEIERRQKAIREKLDRLDQAFLFERRSTSIHTTATATSCAEELTLAQMDRHLSELEEMDVEASGVGRAPLYRARRTSGSSFAQSSACSRCSFRMEFASTGKGLLEPAQPCRVFNYLSPFRKTKTNWWTKVAPAGTAWLVGCGKSIV